jgi:bifunctional UDP-N-acetylglucosamine pyrophosphorylase / glucosamine-1-phosphate N-acetyltransferase
MDYSKGLSVIILAAGKGKRMKSTVPKVLHRICGQPVIYYILEQVNFLGPKNIFVVIGHRKELVRDYLKRVFPSVAAVNQDVQSGTANAVKMAEDYFPDMGDNILVISGDTPLITAATLDSLVRIRYGNNLAVSLLTSIAEDPAGYGRIIKDRTGRIVRIIEDSDASPEEKKINEVNSSIYCFERNILKENIGSIQKHNSQGEYYLTDIVETLINKGAAAETFIASDHREAIGINNRFQLSEAEDIIRCRINKKHMENGVTIRSSSTVYIENTVKIEADTIIEPSCCLKGETIIGKGCSIGPFSVIKDSKIGHHTTVESSVIISSEIGCRNYIGPYNYIKSGTVTGGSEKVEQLNVTKSITAGYKEGLEELLTAENSDKRDAHDGAAFKKRQKQKNNK